MAYIALRPCSFGGEKFYVGNVVPIALIRPEMVRRLTAAGVITEAREQPESEQSELENKPEPEAESELETESEPEPVPKSKRAKNKKPGGD